MKRLVRLLVTLKEFWKAGNHTRRLRKLRSEFILKVKATKERQS